MITDRAHPGRIGVLLVLGSALLLASTVWLLPTTHADHLRAGLTAAAMTGAALIWWAGGTRTAHAYALLGYPLIIFGAVAAVGSVTDGVGASYAGLITVCFIYIGLFAPHRSTVALVPPAVACWLLSNGLLEGAPLRDLAVRLPVAAVAWCCVGILLSQHAQAAQRANASLRRQAYRDPLTGLRNRRAMEEILLSAEPGDAVVVLDLDHFKLINDTLGHAAGDDLLVHFARVLRRSIRDQDVAIRYGGDEFLLYLPRTELHNVGVVLRRIQRVWHHQATETTFSAGIAGVRAGRDGTEALGEADRLLYQAKADGRDRWASPLGPDVVPVA